MAEQEHDLQKALAKFDTKQANRTPGEVQAEEHLEEFASEYNPDGAATRAVLERLAATNPAFQNLLNTLATKPESDNK